MGQAITDPSPFRIFGHRGSPKRSHENTISSFEETLLAGADGFETDLRLLADGTPVLFHDDELDAAVTESLTLDECLARGARVERLADLARFAGRTTMILEVKRRGWESRLAEIVRDWPDIVVASFDHSVVTALRESGIPVGITVYGFIVDVADYATRLGATWCFPGFRYVDESMVRSLSERGIQVVPWTANRPAEWEHLRAIGCAGVITDVPDAAVAWRRAAS